MDDDNIIKKHKVKDKQKIGWHVNELVVLQLNKLL